MDKENVLQRLHQHQANLDALEVESLILFGSVSRAEPKKSSDVDFVVTSTSPPTFDIYIDLKFFLEDLLECPVDLVTVDAVREQIRPSIMKDGIHVA